MTQKNQPGYPLPSGDLGNDELVCQLVFLPDRPEYWQAFLGAYHYMSTWRAWERDDDKRGRDAAANWRAAFEKTMECWRMACLEQLQQDVSDILKALEAGVCCPEMDPTDGDQYTDEVEDGVGDVPQNIIDAGYADDAADWDGFDDYKCMVAHIVVDSMEAKFRKLAPHVDSASAVAGGIAAVAIIISAIWTGGLSLLLAGLISSLGGVALFYDAMISGSALETLADKIATNHDALACAFYMSDGLEASVAGIKAEIAELFNVVEEVLLDNSGIDIDAKALYGGRYNQIDTAAVLEGLGYDTGDYGCQCFDGDSGLIGFDSQAELDLINPTDFNTWLDTQGGRSCIKFWSNGSVSWKYAYLSTYPTVNYFTPPWTTTWQLKIRALTFDYYIGDPEASMDASWDWKIEYRHTTASNWIVLWSATSATVTKNEWVHVDVTHLLGDYCTLSTSLLRISQKRGQNENQGRHLYLDSIFLGVEKDTC